MRLSEPIIIIHSFIHSPTYQQSAITTSTQASEHRHSLALDVVSAGERINHCARASAEAHMREYRRLLTRFIAMESSLRRTRADHDSYLRVLREEARGGSADRRRSLAFASAGEVTL